MYTQTNTRQSSQAPKNPEKRGLRAGLERRAEQALATSKPDHLKPPQTLRRFRSYQRAKHPHFRADHFLSQTHSACHPCEGLLCIPSTDHGVMLWTAQLTGALASTKSLTRLTANSCTGKCYAVVYTHCHMLRHTMLHASIPYLTISYSILLITLYYVILYHDVFVLLYYSPFFCILFYSTALYEPVFWWLELFHSKP